MAASTPILFFLIIAATNPPQAAAHAPPQPLSVDINPAFPPLLTALASLAGAQQVGFVLNRSCSAVPVRWVGFEPALNELLARLRVGLLIGGRFSYADNTTIDGNTIYGIIGCTLQTVTTSECRTCIDAATSELTQECGGQTQGYIGSKSCFVRFKLSFSPQTWSVLGDDGKEGQKDTSPRVRLVLIGWTILGVCLAGFVFSAWLVQRSIVNRAKVSALDDTILDGKL